MVKTIVKILGTAQDGGYPQPGCDCPNCRAAKSDPRLIRYPASVGLLDPESQKSFIIDPSPFFPDQLQLLNQTACKLNFPDNHLSGIFITHGHMGHYPGLMYLGKEAINTSDLPVHTSQKMEKYLLSNQPWRGLITNNNIKIKQFTLEQEITLGNSLKIIPISVPHRSEYTDTVGFIIKGNNKSLFYLPDIDGWTNFYQKFNKISQKVDFLLIDGTFYTRQELTKFRDRNIKNVPHPPIEETINLLQKGKLNSNNAQVFFTHFNHTNQALCSSFNPKLDDQKISFLEEGKIFKI